MKRFVCKAKLIKKEGYTGIFVTRKGLRFKLPYKDLKVGEIGEIYYFKNNKKEGDFAVFRPRKIIEVPFYKGRK